MKSLHLAGILKIIWSQVSPKGVHEPLAEPFTDRWGWSLPPRTPPPHFIFMTSVCTIAETLKTQGSTKKVLLMSHTQYQGNHYYYFSFTAISLKVFFKNFLKIFIYLFLERGEGKEKKRERRNIAVGGKHLSFSVCLANAPNGVPAAHTIH